MPVRVPPKLQRRRKGHDGVVKMASETPPREGPDCKGGLLIQNNTRI